MKTYLLPLLALLALAQCKKKPDPAPVPPNPVDLLPAPTQTGLRTFGCLVNGQAWTPAGNPFGGPLFNTQYFNQELTISASRSGTINGVRISQGIQLNAYRIQSIGRYPLADSVRNFVNVVDLLSNCTYYSSSIQPGVLEITRLDLVNRIVSGTFSFTLEKPGCGRIVVTDGRFDSRF